MLKPKQATCTNTVLCHVQHKANWTCRVIIAVYSTDCVWIGCISKQTTCVWDINTRRMHTVFYSKVPHSPRYSYHVRIMLLAHVFLQKNIPYTANSTRNYGLATFPRNARQTPNTCVLPANSLSAVSDGNRRVLFGIHNIHFRMHQEL